MEYEIAVRTYDRPTIFQHATLRLLREHNLEQRLTVFVGSDLTPYKNLEPSLRYVSVPRGGAAAIRAICAHYPLDTPILFLDDDLEAWYGGNLSDMIRSGFERSPFWGFGFTTNEMWLQKLKDWAPHYATIAGCSFGARNIPALITTQYSHCDDIVRTIQFMESGIQPMSWKKAGFKTQYAKNAGGLQSSGDRDDTRAVAEAIYPTISDWTVGVVQQSCGLWAIKMSPAPVIKKKMKLILAAADATLKRESA